MGNKSSKSNSVIQYSYHIQKETEKEKYELIWPSTDLSQFCFREEIAGQEFNKCKTQNPLINYRLVRYPITMKNHVNIGGIGALEVISV